MKKEAAFSKGGKIDRFRVGMVGAGAMAREHIRAFSSLENVSIEAVTSRTELKAKSMKSEFSIPRYFPSVKTMCEQSKLDIIVVAVNEESSLSVLREAISFRVPILAEKPIGINEEECLEIHELSKKRKTKIWVGLNRRSYSSTRAALTDLATEPGTRLIEVHDQQDTKAARSMGFPERTLKHWMFANSVHLIDYFSIFSRGKISSVRVIDRCSTKRAGVVTAHIHFSSGDLGWYKAVWNMPGPWMCAVTTREKRWELRPLENARMQKRGSRTAIEIPVSDTDKQFKPGFRFQAEDVVKAVRTGRPTEFVPELEEAFETVKLVARIYEMGRRR